MSIFTWIFFIFSFRLRTPTRSFAPSSLPRFRMKRTSTNPHATHPRPPSLDLSLKPERSMSLMRYLMSLYLPFSTGTSIDGMYYPSHHTPTPTFSKKSKIASFTFSIIFLPVSSSCTFSSTFMPISAIF